MTRAWVTDVSAFLSKKGLSLSAKTGHKFSFLQSSPDFSGAVLDLEALPNGCSQREREIPSSIRVQIFSWAELTPTNNTSVLSRLSLTLLALLQPINSSGHPPPPWDWMELRGRVGCYGHKGDICNPTLPTVVNKPTISGSGHNPLIAVLLTQLHKDLRKCYDMISRAGHEIIIKGFQNKIFKN